ncbi:hypothetical protein [Oceanospirillum sediminis]|uniref:STAS/SEC14 domain-containing protein n=1 Tax=Oceanospirillum sediminis TaxID=2760088 RepID=A0A839ISJ2_9GAMM|nr:hypothetical protein [Oceanospirillum sediminis]MBB1487407.1 hypothetical protein [Oceanospirillum sediminis]
MNIETDYDESIRTLIVKMHGLNRLSILEGWKDQFLQTLSGYSDHEEKISLMIDTRYHEFESYQCLVLLRQLFTSEILQYPCIDRKVFVQPGRYRLPEVKNDYEAYFSSPEEALQWLMCFKQRFA